MTEEQLTGRELDEACAQAVGTWKDVCDGGQDEYYDGWICDGCGGVTGDWGHDLEPHPKTKTTQDEKLAWLKQFGGYVEITVWADFPGTGCNAKLGGTAGHRLDKEVHGSTIHEALARLVVAVAKERSE